MNIITRHDLSKLSICELRGLLRQTFDAVAQAVPDSAERRRALISLKNIQAELGARPKGF